MIPWQPPPWLTVLAEEDLLFLKRFLLASGSLKQLADVYGVSYPTIRTRLNRIIEKVAASEVSPDGDPFENLVEVLLDQGVLVSGTARSLIHAHKRVVRDASDRAERLAGTEQPTEMWHD